MIGYGVDGELGRLPCSSLLFSSKPVTATRFAVNDFRVHALARFTGKAAERTPFATAVALAFDGHFLLLVKLVQILSDAFVAVAFEATFAVSGAVHAVSAVPAGVRVLFRLPRRRFALHELKVLQYHYRRKR